MYSESWRREGGVDPNKIDAILAPLDKVPEPQVLPSSNSGVECCKVYFGGVDGERLKEMSLLDRE